MTVTDDAITLLQRDVERLETVTIEQGQKLAAMNATVGSMGREIGQLRADQKDGFGGLTDEVKNGRRVQLGLAVTIAGSSLMLVIGLLVTFGGRL